MSRQIDPRANGPNPEAVAVMMRFDALVAEVRALRERADRLSLEAEGILADNPTDRAALLRRQ